MGKFKALLNVLQKKRASLLDVVVFGTLTFTTYILLSDIAMSSKKNSSEVLLLSLWPIFANPENLTVSAVVVMVLHSQDKVNMKKVARNSVSGCLTSFCF